MKRYLPLPLKRWWWKQLETRPRAAPFAQSGNLYERIYETHAQTSTSDEQAIGSGDFGRMGNIELDLLVMEGLQPKHVLVDFGCGVGRLAVHAIPTLKGGSYIGIDISDTLLGRARERIRRVIPHPPCDVRLIKHLGSEFPLADESVDMICAFSVFTHMEHEDSYRYLKDARRIIRPGGRFIFSCLPIRLPWSKDMFLQQASIDIGQRWSSVRNVTTSEDYMDEICRLAGWRTVRWYRGDENDIISPDGERRTLGQASCALEAER